MISDGCTEHARNVNIATLKCPHPGRCTSKLASKALFGKKSFDRALQKADQAASLLGHDLPMLNVVLRSCWFASACRSYGTD